MADEIGEDPARAAVRRAALVHRRPGLDRVLARAGLGRYRGYGEMLEAIDRLASRGARVEEIGKSVRGEPLLAVHLGNPRPTRGTPTSVIVSGLHPSAWIGVEITLRLLDRLAGEDLHGRSLVAFPIANPDGVLRVEMNLRTGKRRRVDHNAHGVDLDRNFDARWGQRGVLHRVFARRFSPGRRAASEPEVQAIAHALADRRVDRAVSLHGGDGVILYPSAATLWPIADRAEHAAWAAKIARAASPMKPLRATAASIHRLGRTAGGLDLDWFHERHGALAFVIDCPRGSIARPSRLFQPFAWKNPHDVEGASSPIVEALVPFLRGDRA